MSSKWGDFFVTLEHVVYLESLVWAICKEGADASVMECAQMSRLHYDNGQ